MATPILFLGGVPVATARTTVAGCQALYCEGCEDVIWTVSHPYWSAGTVRAMHLRGTGHKVLPLVMVGPVTTCTEAA